MIPKKKRITIMVIAIVVIMLIIIIAGLLLYLKTDMFKSNKTLFAKYIGQNMENLKALETTLQEANYEETFKNNKYTENSEIKMNYTENIGTTSENTNNDINKLKLVVEGQTDKTNKYDYKNIKLLNDNNQVANVEYIQNDNTYGLKFSDLFKQYVLVENNNLKNLLNKIGYTDEQVANIPDSIETSILENISFTEEEIENLKNKYLDIINQNVSNEKFKKEKNQTIVINQKNIIANAYILSLSKEEMNNIYIKILENLKQDEIILGKLEKIQNCLNVINIFNSESAINIKEDFVEKVESTIQEITQTNIGNDEFNITVYESDGQTVSTSINGKDYEVYCDFLFDESENFIEIGVIESGEENKKYTLKYNQNEINLTIKDGNDEELTNITYTQTTKINDRNYTKNIVVKREGLDNRIELTMTQNLNIIDNFSEEVVLDNQNSIQLNQLEENNLKQIVNRISEGINGKIESLQQEINKEEINKVFEVMGIVKTQNILEGTGISEVEKNRFNSIFDMLKGENLNSDQVIQAIESIKGYLNNMETISNQELKLEISRSQNNEELAETLKAFIEKDKSRKYNIGIEYDENGLVKYLILTIVEER